MFSRSATSSLEKWSSNKNRKPLVLRGARQVGKTSLVIEFSKQFRQFVHLNLEIEKHRLLFENNYSFEELVDAIFYFSKMTKDTSETIVFIDEIQNSGNAITMLRYFYENLPELRVVAAGSLLETTLNRNISFPVGRVDFLYIHPCSFIEYLWALGEKQNADLIQGINVPNYAHETIMKHFHRFALIGGMPEVVQQYSEHFDVKQLKKIYQSLIVGYRDDVEKYAPNNSGIQHIRHILRTGFNYAGQRIKFEKFGESNYRSREMGESFRLLEKTMLLELVYPVGKPTLPLLANYRKSPKLHWLDIGLVNFMAKVQDDVFFSSEIFEGWRGLTAEIIVGQELLSSENDVLAQRFFWLREQKNSMAEVDFIYPFHNLAIPIEVKSGRIGKLKSLHLFMDEAPHNIAVRVWAKSLSVDLVKTPNGKEFKLINLPFYYIGILDSILEKYVEY